MENQCGNAIIMRKTPGAYTIDQFGQFLPFPSKSRINSNKNNTDDNDDFRGSRKAVSG